MNHLKLAFRYALIHRIFLFLVMMVVVGPASLFNGKFGLSLTGWDANHYFRVAKTGYEATGTEALMNFFPVFPFLLRFLGWTGMPLWIAGTLVNFLASVGVLVFLLKLLEREPLSETQRKRMLLLFLCFPTAHFLAVPYTEALFCLFCFGSFYFAWKAQYLWLALFCLLAPLTRVNGFLLFLPLFAEVFSHSRRARILLPLKAWAALSCLGVGVLGVLLINYTVTGDPLRFMHVQREIWGHVPVSIWGGLIDAVKRLISSSSSWTLRDDAPLRVFCTAFCVPLLLMGARKLRFSYHLWCWLNLFLFLSMSWQICFPRYLIILFPCFIVLSSLLTKRFAFLSVAGLFLAMQTYFFSLFLRGQWAF